MQRMTPAKKKHSPVRVVNPVGDNHVVCLHPNQPFLVLVSPWVGLVDMQFESDFFELAEEEKLRDGTVLMMFRQKFDLSSWAKVGSIYLGTVLIVGGHVAASLCVVLESSKTDVFTVVNPQGTEVKIHPHQLLEVVLYDDIYQGKWMAKCIPGEEDIQYRQCGYETIMATSVSHALADAVKPMSNFVVFPRACDNFTGREHHHWFEFDVTSTRKIAKWNTGTFKGGRIVFAPMTHENGAPEERILHVELSVRGKNRRKLMIPKRLPERLPDGLPCDTRMPGTDDEDQTILLPADDPDNIYNNDYDDLMAGHSPDYRATDYRTNAYTQIHVPTSGKRRVNNNCGTAFCTPRAFTTRVTIKERQVPETADPMLVGTTSVDQANIPAHLLTVAATKWDRFRHDY